MTAKRTLGTALLVTGALIASIGGLSTIAFFLVTGDVALSLGNGGVLLGVGIAEIFAGRRLRRGKVAADV